MFAAIREMFREQPIVREAPTRYGWRYYWRARDGQMWHGPYLSRDEADKAFRSFRTEQRAAWKVRTA